MRWLHNVKVKHNKMNFASGAKYNSHTHTHCSVLADDTPAHTTVCTPNYSNTQKVSLGEMFIDTTMHRFRKTGMTTTPYVHCPCTDNLKLIKWSHTSTCNLSISQQATCLFHIWMSQHLPSPWRHKMHVRITKTTVVRCLTHQQNSVVFSVIV